METRFDGAGPELNPQRADESIRSVLLAWGTLCLVYNGILAGVILSCGVHRFREPAFWAALGEWMPFANLSFCAGPFAECFLVRLLKANRTGLRWVVFLGGLALASMLTLVGVLLGGRPKMGFMS